MTAAFTRTPPFGALMRQWRTRRRLSQLELAGKAAVSARHVSFIETGRSNPSRAMVLRLAETLDVPPREQTFGTALDLTAAELSVEAFLPADDATRAALR